MTAVTTGINYRLVTSSSSVWVQFLSPCEKGTPRLTMSLLHLLFSDLLLLWFQVGIGSGDGLKSRYIFSKWFAATFAMRQQHSFHMVSWYRSRANASSPPTELDKHSVLLLCIYEWCIPKQFHSSQILNNKNAQTKSTVNNSFLTSRIHFFLKVNVRVFSNASSSVPALSSQ